jgi:hypothetical protein
MFIQASSLDDAKVTELTQRMKADSEISRIALTEWDVHKATLIKNVIPYSPDGKYKRFFAGVAAPSSQDYRNILNGTWRWSHLEASTAAALQALPFADGWYINYETGINVFESEAYRAPWEWYLGDMVRRLRAIKDVPIVWSPYLIGAYSQKAVDGYAKTLLAVRNWYSPGAKIEVHPQDGVGARLQTAASALKWIRGMKVATPGITTKVNAEWFDVLDYKPVNATGRESFYRLNAIPIGFCWEARYWAAAKSVPTVPTFDQMIARYIQAVSAQPRAGQAPNNRDHARDTDGPYWERAQYTTLKARWLMEAYNLSSLGQWRSLAVVPRPGDGRDPNSDHYSGGAFDFRGTRSEMEKAANVLNTDGTVAFAKVHGNPLHLHVSFKLEGDLS